ncbi:MAG: D-tyrosyl-tRNA(Tyr) deacylase [Bacteroidales bacterium]|nr:D-tyrosyl-tRNA(Tyr) deacylase [Bacteroidales bacterium]
MRTVIQRVTSASVAIAGQTISAIGPGLMVLIGIAPDDGPDDIAYLVKKIAALRIFNDDAGVMNRSVIDIGGEILVVSQFTLMASTAKGNRPSYIGAARPEIAIPLYEAFCANLSTAISRPVATGRFGADMAVTLTNDGPVTISIDSRSR